MMRSDPSRAIVTRFSAIIEHAHAGLAVRCASSLDLSPRPVSRFNASILASVFTDIRAAWFALVQRCRVSAMSGSPTSMPRNTAGTDLVHEWSCAEGAWRGNPGTPAAVLW